MELSGVDIITFVGFIAFVIGVSLYASRKEETSEDYFLAGRSLTWWLIGLSLVASNISTEHFIGMGGNAAVGMFINSKAFNSPPRLEGTNAGRVVVYAVPR